MKTAVLCGVCGAAAFAIMLGVQLSLSSGTAPEPETAAKVEEKPAPKPQFPEDLAPAARYAPIPEAAPLSKSQDPHPTAMLTAEGQLHPWHERLPPDWRSDSIESTELVVLLSEQQQTVVQVVTYPKAPAVRRVRYELTATLVEARTGKLIAQKLFTSEPRQVGVWEPFELTLIGEPVECAVVNQWLRQTANRRAQVAMEQGAR